MKINSINPAFKGYRNIIFDNYDLEDYKFTLLAMELNDKDGHNDLAEFKKLQKIIPFDKEISEFDEVLFLLYNRVSNKSKFFLNTQKLLSGRQLKRAEYNLEPDEYSKIEKFHLKAYTLLASITRRIMQNTPYDTDSNIGRVFLGAYRMLIEASKDSQKSYNLIMDSFNTKESLPKAGFFINDKIHKTMDIFFRM